MSSWEILSAVALGLAVNEFCDLSPWLARRLVPGAAKLWSKTPEEATAYAEEWAAVIDERPGKLFKLITALTFLSGAILRAAPRLKRKHFALSRPRLRGLASTQEEAIRWYVRGVTATLGLLNTAGAFIAIGYGHPGAWKLAGLPAAFILIYVALARSYARNSRKAPGSAKDALRSSPDASPRDLRTWV